MLSTKAPPANHFPSKLHEMLDDAEEKRHAHIVSWCPDGRSFKIHQPNCMVPVLSSYFRQTKYKSLLRQLQGYNFSRITSGDNKGNVSHPLFVRGMKDLCAKMKRKTNKGSATPNPLTKIGTKSSNASAVSNTTVVKKHRNVQLPPPSNHSHRAETILMSSDPINVTSSQVVNDTFVQTPAQPLPVLSGGPIHPKPVTSCNGNGNGTVTAPQITSSNCNIPKSSLQPNFKYTLNNPIHHEQNQKNYQKQPVTQILPAPPALKSTQGPKSAGMDYLRMEIGCTFAPSKANIRTSLKRSLSHQPQHGVDGEIHTSASAPILETGRLAKRQRSHEGGEQFLRCVDSEDMVKPGSNTSSSFQNAYFSFSTSQPRTDEILKEEKLRSQNRLQDKQDFAQLEKLFCSNVFEPVKPNFQHSVRSTSAIGTLDLNVSLTTTRTTTNHQIGVSQVSSNTISDKFVFPSFLEPTPLLSPSKTQAAEATTVSCGITYPSATQSDNLKLKLPFFNTTEDTDAFDGGLTNQSTVGNCLQGVGSEVSDEIDEGIAEAFDDDVERIELNPTESGIQVAHTNEPETEDDWTDGIVYEGGTDCVLEPDKFQMEVQRMLSRPPQKSLQQKRQLLDLQHHRTPEDQSIVQQLQAAQQQRIPATLRRMSALDQVRSMPMGTPYALLARPMPFRMPGFPSQIQ